MAVETAVCRECRGTLVEGAAFCQNCGTQVTSPSATAVETQITELRHEVERLSEKVTGLNDIAVGWSKTSEAQRVQLESSNIFSPKFWTRAWAIYGHLLAVGLILSLLLFPIALLAAAEAGF